MEVNWDFVIWIVSDEKKQREERLQDPCSKCQEQEFPSNSKRWEYVTLNRSPVDYGKSDRSNQNIHL